MLIKGPQIYSEQGILPAAGIVLADGKIKAILPSDQSAQYQGESLDFPSSYHLIPGMIDTHIHGLMGMDVMDGTEAALQTISTTLPREGTTSFLATTMTEAADKIGTAVKAVHAWQNKTTKPVGAEILGVHLEGPFLAPQRMNAQNEKYRLDADIELLKKWQQIGENNIRLVTLAPEIPGALELITYLQQQQIIAAIGHSDATFAEANAAIAAGSNYATHLFNAMRPVHHREPGIIAACLLSDAVTAELIADGIHVHPSMLELALKLKGNKKLLLVTDAMRAKCLGPGVYEFGGQQVTVTNNEVRLANGVLAGSVLSMQEALRNVLAYTGCQLIDALPMVSANPARLLGIFDRKGSIAVGKDADIVVLDEQLQVVTTFCKGVRIMQN